jgi:hypothetical protein
MKKLSTIALLLIWAFSIYAQNIKVDPQMIKLGWTLVSPLIINKVKDTLTREIISKAIPKIIDQDAKGAALEVTDAIYKYKKVKVLNKDFLVILDNNISDGITAIKQKDYATAVNGLVATVAVTAVYLKNGSLGLTESVTPVSTSSLNITDIVTSQEINEKIHLDKNNNYLFFMTDGIYNQQTENTSNHSAKVQMENFNVTLDDGKKFNISIEQSFSAANKQTNIDKIRSDTAAKNKIKNDIYKSLATNLGEGTILVSSVTNSTECPNFEALKYKYLYNDKTTFESSMAYAYVAFKDSARFLISFSTPSTDFTVTSKSFDNLLLNFIIIGVDQISNENTTTTSNTTTSSSSSTTTNTTTTPVKKSTTTTTTTTTTKKPCETNKKGILTIVNKSSNPYYIYKNGTILMALDGKQIKTNIYVDLGSTTFKAVQKSGYVLYATENIRAVTFSTACEEKTIYIGFED